MTPEVTVWASSVPAIPVCRTPIGSVPHILPIRLALRRHCALLPRPGNGSLILIPDHAAAQLLVVEGKPVFPFGICVRNGVERVPIQPALLHGHDSPSVGILPPGSEDDGSPRQLQEAVCILGSRGPPDTDEFVRDALRSLPPTSNEGGEKSDGNHDACSGPRRSCDSPGYP